MKAAEKYLTEFFKIKNAEIINEIIHVSKVRSFNKKDHIIKTGTVIHEVSFLIKGSVKNVTYSIEGSEKINGIYHGMSGPVCIMDFNPMKEMIASADVIALTKCKALTIPVKDLNALSDKYPEFKQVMFEQYIYGINQILEYIMVLNRFHNNLFGLYEYYVENLPKTIANATLEELAALFGVSIYQLSRIQSRYRKEKQYMYSKMLEYRE